MAQGRKVAVLRLGRDHFGASRTLFSFHEVVASAAGIARTMNDHASARMRGD
jgi:hypothetical protein